MFNKLVRQDGFYAGNIAKMVDGENRKFIVAIFFVTDYIFFDLEKVDTPVDINASFSVDIKNMRNNIIKGLQDGSVKVDDLPRNFTRYKEESRSVFADFKDGTDDMKLIMMPHIFGGTVIHVDLEGMVIDWVNPSNGGFKKRRIIDFERIKFFKF